MTTVLVVDDDRHVLHMVATALADLDLQVQSVESAESALANIKQKRPDLVLIDLMLPNMDGLEFLDHIRRDDLRLPVIVMSGNGSAETTIEAMKNRADDYLTKPLDLQLLRSSVQRSLANGQNNEDSVEIVPEQANSKNVLGMMLSDSHAMQEVYKSIGRVAAQSIPVLIQGESGTGKELVATAVWNHSERANKIFLAVNCAALPEMLLESELFGHEKGSFTGADQVRQGKFEQCDGGTLFLDEVGDMSLGVQAKVLRLLQAQSFQRVGGTKQIRTNVRVIAATNCDLEKMCNEGSFRQDLYFRLNGYSIQLPPLRERGRDVELLIEHFVRKFSSKLGKQIDGISRGAYEALVNYSWPGNVRELQTTLSRAVLDARTTHITRDCLPAQMCFALPGSEPHDPTTARRMDAANRSIVQPHSPIDSETSVCGSSCDVAAFLAARSAADSHSLLAETNQFVERYIISELLIESQGNQSQAALRLGISRGSLRHKIKSLGISLETSVSHV